MKIFFFSLDHLNYGKAFMVISIRDENGFIQEKLQNIQISEDYET